jgi:hypothetical protein
MGEVIAGAAIEAHLCAILASDDAEAVVLDLVQPLAARRQCAVLIGRHGAMNPAGRVRFNMRADAMHSRGFIQSLRPRQQCLRYCEAERFRGLRLTIEFHGLLDTTSPWRACKRHRAAR